jgi:hypothetical protein
MLYVTCLIIILITYFLFLSYDLIIACPDFVKISIFFKRNSTSNWNDYNLYFLIVKRLTYSSFIRDLTRIANHKDLLSSIQKRARNIADRVKNNKTERNVFWIFRIPTSIIGNSFLAFYNSVITDLQLIKSETSC